MGPKHTMHIPRIPPANSKITHVANHASLTPKCTWLFGGGETQHPLSVGRAGLPPSPPHPRVEGRRLHVPETVAAIRRDRSVDDLLRDVVLSFMSS